ncbi:MAG: hypothetical protein O7C73_03705, partial [Nitrospirae bacterium]|nr:hypothetical protein [Nitrospirota bacterium]
MWTKRFRSGRRSRRQSAPKGLRARAEWRVRGERWSSQVEVEWKALHQVCTDLPSRSRLTRLVTRLSSNDRGAQESALAELELAMLLFRAGFRIRFLPESQARTADLECTLGLTRLFVEVTALVGSPRRPRQRPIWRARRTHDQEEYDGGCHELLERLLARTSQKARQLVHYCAPVLLGITVPPQDRRSDWAEKPCDLKQLAGTITLLLTRLQQVSAVLLSLWGVEPSPAQSGVRLANVHMVERSRHQAAYPRVRL